MKLIPHHQGDKHGHREYRSPDGTWKVVRTRRPGGNPNERPRWEVHERHEDHADWHCHAAFERRRDALVFLDTTAVAPRGKSTASPPKYPARPRPPAGSTPAERALTALARHTFLSLWSYPNVVRDEHVASGHVIGKEIVDLLVVFENNIVLFSDKDCAFPSSGNLDTDWSRWYRKAIAKSAKQLWGADRHIRQNPGRVFIDAKCKIFARSPHCARTSSRAGDRQSRHSRS